MLSFSIPNIIDSSPPPNDDALGDTINNTTPNGKFRIWARYYILTYRSHLDKMSTAAYFIDLGAITCRIAHETGNIRIPYHHSHVFVDFGRQFHSANARVFDLKELHPNIGPISYQKHLNRVYKYMCKEDHSNDDMKTWVTESHIQDIWDHDTLQSAVKQCALKDVMNTIAAYNLKPKLPNTPRDWEFEWQYELEIRVTTTSQPRRQIWWYQDNLGGAGKTDFCIGMLDRYPKDTYVFTQFGGAKDTATIIINALNNGWSGKYCIIDLPRAAETKSIYEPLESIRNGMITAIKYQGSTVRWDSKWVIVMANFPPEFGVMSADRWVIYDMSLPKFKLRCMDVSRVLETTSFLTSSPSSPLSPSTPSPLHCDETINDM